MKRHTILWILVGISTSLGILYGCHADPDDPAGQAGELSDPARRDNALTNIQRMYQDALAASNNDRSAMTIEEDGRERPGPKKIADDTIAALVRTHEQLGNEHSSSRRIIDLLREMQDVRGLPAFIRAVEWVSSPPPNYPSEEAAISAARAIETLHDEISAEQKGEVITALSNALDRIQQPEGVYNRMRIHFIRALGALEDRRATPILTKIAMRIAEDQDFLINRLAVEAQGSLRDPEATDEMIKALFLFGANNFRLRMNDLGAQGLVQIGRPALDPLIATLRGENESANTIVTNYMAALERGDPAAAEGVTDAIRRERIRSTVIGESCYALGQLGFREAIDPIMSQIEPLTSVSVREANEGLDNEEIYGRAHGCLVALVSISRNESDAERVRNALTQVYERIPKVWPPVAPGSGRMQLLVAMQHSYDPGLLDYLHTIARTPEDELPDLRVLAVQAYAYIANRAEAERLNAIIAAEPGPEEGGFRQNFEENRPMLAAAQECDSNLECWIGKLGDSDPKVVRKAAYMIARYGRGNEQAITALIAQIDHVDQFVRGDVLYAIDWVATSGSAEAVAEIDRLRQAEENTSAWNQIKDLAMAVRARLNARASGGG